MNVLEFFRENDGSYYSRRIKALIIVYLVGWLASLLSLSTGIYYLSTFFSDFKSSIALALGGLIAISIEWAKTSFIADLSRETFKLKYTDFLLLFMSVCLVLISVFASVKGAEIKAEKAAEKAAPPTLSDSLLLSATGQKVELTTLEGRKFKKGASNTENYVSIAANKAAAKAAAANAEISANLVELSNQETERLKLQIEKEEKEKAEKAAKEKEQKENSAFLIIFYEFVIILCSFTAGYIRSHKQPLKSAKQAIKQTLGQPNKQPTNKDLDKIKAILTTDRHRLRNELAKHNPDAKKVSELEAKIKESEIQIFALGGQLPTQRKKP